MENAAASWSAGVLSRFLNREAISEPNDSRLAEAEESGGAPERQLHAALVCGDGGGRGRAAIRKAPQGQTHSKIWRKSEEA
jgi:hypothetical protein